jgi:ankyrin repeat protein
MVASGVGQGAGPDRLPERVLIEAVKAAVALGAEVNAANSNGVTAAHGAAGSGFLGIISLLAEQGADLNARDKRGQTPLAVAQARSAAEAVALLKTLGATDDNSGRPEAASIAPAPQR